MAVPPFPAGPVDVPPPFPPVAAALTATFLLPVELAEPFADAEPPMLWTPLLPPVAVTVTPIAPALLTLRKLWANPPTPLLPLAPPVLTLWAITFVMFGSLTVK